MAANGETPRVFTAVMRDSTQLTVPLDGIPLKPVHRIDFLRWLCASFDIIAYAYATRVMKQTRAGSDELIEALDLYSSSFTMDVSASLKLIRRPDGVVHYVRDSYVATEAKEPSLSLFCGLQRTRSDFGDIDVKVFKHVWSLLEPRAHWRRRQT